MTTYRKKLIEVALPLTELSEACSEEKQIHTGLPPNLHAWWSRKPLAVARAVLLASILDDPGDGPDAATERHRLLNLVMRASEPGVLLPQGPLADLRQVIATATGGKPPCVWDPFCGGGTIPLEASRLGFAVQASDLNPVATLITQAMVETIPRARQDLERRGSQSLAELTLLYAERLKKRAAAKIGRLFESVSVDGRNVAPIAWIWARTVQCPNPACQASAPLVNKFWLSTHEGNIAWAQPDYSDGTCRFIVRTTGTPPPGTVNKSGARCAKCASPIPFTHIRAEGRGGRLGYVPMGVVADVGGPRRYLAAEGNPLGRLPKVWVPETSLPEKALGFRVQAYGLTRHADLFTPRQLVTVSTFADDVEFTAEEAAADTGSAAVGDAVALLLAFAVDRLAQTNCALVRWRVRSSGTSKGEASFDRPIVSMTWEFSEGHPFGASVGSWDAAVKNVVSALRSIPDGGRGGHVTQRSALTDDDAVGTGLLISTDPPYFHNMGYSDLSDFFYVWLRRSLSARRLPCLATVLVPKADELTAAPHAFNGDRQAAETHFEAGLTQAFHVMAKRASPEYPVSVYYAFKQTETDAPDDEGESGEGGAASTGWEKMLAALIAAGFEVTGTWPVRTESRTRLRALKSNALASSIVLVCRRRPEDAASTTRGEFRRLLRRELPDALKKLQQGNIAPVDVAQASIGPGMAIFSRHRHVLEADGAAMSVRSALQLINEVLDEYLASGEGDFDADTRFAITWYEQHGWDAGAFGDAETLAKARNVSVAGVVEAGICHSAAGKVRILKRQEMRPLDYDPAADKTPTVWEFTQHMIRHLEEEGEERGARLLKRLGARADATRELAYRLFNTCERRKWAEDARSYNGLILAWPELEKLAARMTDESPTTAPGKAGKKSKAMTKDQQDLFGGDDK